MKQAQTKNLHGFQRLATGPETKVVSSLTLATSARPERNIADSDTSKRVRSTLVPSEANNEAAPVIIPSDTLFLPRHLREVLPADLYDLVIGRCASVCGWYHGKVINELLATTGAPPMSTVPKHEMI